jgi:hypothetical protein
VPTRGAFTIIASAQESLATFTPEASAKPSRSCMGGAYFQERRSGKQEFPSLSLFCQFSLRMSI